MVIERSALVVTLSVSVAVVLEDVLSVVVETEALFVWSPSVEAGTVYCAVIVASRARRDRPERAAEVSRSARVAGALRGRDRPRVKPAGQVSETETPRASDGPVFVTWIVYVWTVAAPARTLETPSVFVIDRFACVWTVVSIVALVLLAGV